MGRRPEGKKRTAKSARQARWRARDRKRKAEAEEAAKFAKSWRGIS